LGSLEMRGQERLPHLPFAREEPEVSPFLPCFRGLPQRVRVERLRPVSPALDHSPDEERAGKLFPQRGAVGLQLVDGVGEGLRAALGLEEDPVKAGAGLVEGDEGVEAAREDDAVAEEADLPARAVERVEKADDAKKLEYRLVRGPEATGYATL
jgi:hypothetical protein